MQVAVCNLDEGPRQNLTMLISAFQPPELYSPTTTPNVTQITAIPKADASLLLIVLVCSRKVSQAVHPLPARSGPTFSSAKLS